MSVSTSNPSVGKPPPPIQWNRMGWLLLAGATWGAALDYMHTHGGAILYPPDTNHWKGIPTFAVVYAVPAAIYAAGHTPAPPQTTYAAALPSLMVFSQCYALTAYAWRRIPSAALAAGMNAVALWYWFKFDGSARGLALGAAIAVCGCAVEHAKSVAGDMEYQVQDVGAVPWWLFSIYFLAACTWGQLNRRFLRGGIGASD